MCEVSCGQERLKTLPPLKSSPGPTAVPLCRWGGGRGLSRVGPSNGVLDKTAENLGPGGTHPASFDI